MTNAQSRRNHRQSKLKMGMCCYGGCKSDAEPNRRLCQTHLESERKRVLSYYKPRKSPTK